MALRLLTRKTGYGLRYMTPLRKSQLTAPDRLRPLLSWVNGDRNGQDLRFQLINFLNSFDGSAAAGFVDVSLNRLVARLDEPQPQPAGTLAEQFETLRLILRKVLQADAEPRSFPSLRFGVRRVRAPAKRSTLRPHEHRAYQAAGAAVLRVEGGLTDLVPFLVGHLLTAPGMMTVARCPAPRAGHRREPCGRWFVQQVTGPGRPRDYCSDACRVRANDAKPSGARPVHRTLHRRKQR